MATFLKASEQMESISLQVYGQTDDFKKLSFTTIQENDARDIGIDLGILTKARIVAEAGKPLTGKIRFLSKGRALTYSKEEKRFTKNCYDSWWG